MSNSIHCEPSHLDLCCLQKPIIIACVSETVKHITLTLYDETCKSVTLIS